MWLECGTLCSETDFWSGCAPLSGCGTSFRETEEPWSGPGWSDHLQQTDGQKMEIETGAGKVELRECGLAQIRSAWNSLQEREKFQKRLEFL